MRSGNSISARIDGPSFEICILAGGMSRRMGRDKSRLKIGRRTMLGQIRATAKAVGIPVRVIRKDEVSRCGPLGGIYTALKTTRAKAVLFLACDMPFMTAELIHRVLREFGEVNQALFAYTTEGAGFPFALRRDTLPIIVEQIEKREFALRKLARRFKARRMRMSSKWRMQLQNINTPEEYESVSRINR